MKRLLTYSMILSVALFAAACGGDDTSPSQPTTVNFTAALLPANEVPPITNAESSGTGTTTITMHLTRDSAGQITAATADFAISLTGFPAGTSVTLAHIHPGAVGVNGSPLVNLGLVSGANVLATGSGTITVNGIGIGGDVATDIVNNPANYYFNVHSTVNGGGFARGQLVKK